jgi:acyl-CoA synthetase (NDP forming)
VLIKVGASEAGGRAVQSHTGALAGSDEVYRARSTSSASSARRASRN